MYLNILKIFCDLAELKSVSKTAATNILSQSAVSQQLTKLEVRFKCQLINRKKRPLELTKHGEVFYRAAKDIIERYEELKSELSVLGSSTSTRINIAAIYSIGMHSLPKYVKKYMVSYPEINVHIEYLSADKIYEFVLTGDIDIGLVAVPKKDRRLEVHDFEQEPLVLACSTKHHLANESQIDISKVQYERFIGFEKGIPTREWIDNILKRYNITVRTVMEFDNIETIKRAVEINSGVSILPKTAIEQELSAGTLRAIDFTDENFIRPTGIIIRKNRILNKAGRCFVELLRKKLFA